MKFVCVKRLLMQIAMEVFLSSVVVVVVVAVNCCCVDSTFLEHFLVPAKMEIK